ncbi:NADH:flavin oxidoreductase/NADH oxidase [Lichenihabitans sp. Uapishka_5]|uniref:NADH:flavin oxidoreductase/NADH oxidase n=1 Tax=Lichenihabitans sp. Uapishka_5 TaxID=3037302 RepID=UPI0029E7D29D|nr:NADH:flavin oxidoreductase/NADH oxidase [Lichenihabitans sp. Uapishka_5]MDX7950008.1 NADH:flavin oxidoreductase/NADH oxidase [Lichenihabitans sp. Uapishka_5]
MTHLFDPYKLKSVTLRNRIAVSPMCQYMAVNGVANEWHRVHYASLARGGAGLVVLEATAVAPEGRITWGDLGLWNDAQAEALRPIVAGIVEAGAVPGIQIAHAGRKASANRPWEGDDHIPAGQPNSWTTVAPSRLAFGGGLDRVPEELSLDDIKRLQAETVATVTRARDLGFQWLELHMAHGYLAQNFFSPISNHRSDTYGGSAENRARYLLETLVAVRKVWPADRPLTVRLGVVEFDGNDAMLGEAIALLRRMKDEGLDFVDVSIGFNTPDAKIPWAPNFMGDIAAEVRRETGLPGTTSWYISKPDEADALVRDGKVDLVMLGRPLLADPHWPYAAAKALGLDNAAWATLPAPYAHWLARYR